MPCLASVICQQQTDTVMRVMKYQVSKTKGDGGIAFPLAAFEWQSDNEGS